MSPAQTKDLESPTLPFDQLEMDPNFNARTQYDAKKLQELADSIKEHGQNTPLKVRKNGGTKFVVTEGHRRYRAFEMLNWGKKPVKIIFEDVSEKDAYISNLVENENRDDVSSYDFGKRCAELEAGITARDGKVVKVERKELALKTGKSVAHIGNLIRAYNNLSEDARKVWQKGFTAGGKRHELPLSFVFSLARTEDGETLTDEEQAEEIAELIEMAEKADGEGGKKRKKKSAKDDVEAQGATKAEMRDVLECLLKRLDDDKPTGKVKAFLDGKIDALKYALGLVKRPTVMRGSYE